MPTTTGYLLLAVSVFIPTLFAYLGVKSSFRLAAAFRRGEFADLLSKERRSLLTIGSFNLLLAGLLSYGWFIEAHWIETVPVALELSDDAHALSVRIVHLSDLHIEGFGRRERKALDIVRSENPDMICLTGDYLSRGSGDTYLQDAKGFLSELDAPYGVYAVPGNWDFTPTRLFQDTDVVLLEDQVAEVEIEGVKVVITGSRFGVPPPNRDAMAEDALNILLQHSPDFLKEASGAGYDLYLAGHTHGGQIRIPGYGAIITQSKFGKRYEAGLYSMNGTRMYVNRGLGLDGGWSPRVRLFCRPEVTVVDLKAEGIREADHRRSEFR